MKTILVSVILVCLCLVIGCSKTNSANATGNTPQFHLTANDLASPAEVVTNKAETIVVRFKLVDTSARKLKTFTRTHLNQRIEVVCGSRVIAKPVIRSVISDGEIEESFSSAAASQTHAIADLLNRH